MTFSSAKITHEWHCGACNTSVSETRMFGSGDMPYQPDGPPAGWTRVGRQFFCPRHKVYTTVDLKGVDLDGYFIEESQ